MGVVVVVCVVIVILFVVGWFLQRMQQPPDQDSMDDTLPMPDFSLIMAANKRASQEPSTIGYWPAILTSISNLKNPFSLSANGPFLIQPYRINPMDKIGNCIRLMDSSRSARRRQKFGSMIPLAKPGQILYKGRLGTNWTCSFLIRVTKVDEKSAVTSQDGVSFVLGIPVTDLPRMEMGTEQANPTTAIGIGLNFQSRLQPDSQWHHCVLQLKNGTFTATVDKEHDWSVYNVTSMSPLQDQEQLCGLTVSNPSNTLDMDITEVLIQGE